MGFTLGALRHPKLTMGGRPDPREANRSIPLFSLFMDLFLTARLLGR